MKIKLCLRLHPDLKKKKEKYLRHFVARRAPDVETIYLTYKLNEKKNVEIKIACTRKNMFKH